MVRRSGAAEGFVPVATYSIIVRAQYSNKPGMLGMIASGLYIIYDFHQQIPTAATAVLAATTASGHVSRFITERQQRGNSSLVLAALLAANRVPLNGSDGGEEVRAYLHLEHASKGRLSSQLRETVKGDLVYLRRSESRAAVVLTMATTTMMMAPTIARRICA